MANKLMDDEFPPVLPGARILPASAVAVTPPGWHPGMLGAPVGEPAVPIVHPAVAGSLETPAIRMPDPNDARYAPVTGWRAVAANLSQLSPNEGIRNIGLRTLGAPEERYRTDVEAARQGQETQKTQAEIAHERAETEALGNKGPGKPDILESAEGPLQFNTDTNQWEHVTLKGKPVGAKAPEEKAQIIETAQGPLQLDPITKQWNPVTVGGKPVPGKQPSETSYNIAEQLHLEHPEWTPEKIQEETARASFPRILPVNDEKETPSGTTISRESLAEK